MRKVMLSLVLAAAGAIGLAGSTPAAAYDSGRIYVGIGDVTFSYGRPYYRHNWEPLYVVYERGYPRYYRVPAPYYVEPRYAYAPAYYGYGYDRRYDRRYDRYDRYDRRHDRRHDRYDHRWDRDGRRGHRRDWD